VLAIGIIEHPDGVENVETIAPVMATSSIRPGELWAMERDRPRPERSEIYIKYAVKDGGRLGPPKYSQERWGILVPSALALSDALPRLHDRFLFVTKMGKTFTQANWTTYSHPIRVAFTAQLAPDHWLVSRIRDCAEANGQKLHATRASTGGACPAASWTSTSSSTGLARSWPSCRCPASASRRPTSPRRAGGRVVWDEIVGCRVRTLPSQAE
jgi:hypothetical protein